MGDMDPREHDQKLYWMTPRVAIVLGDGVNLHRDIFVSVCLFVGVIVKGTLFVGKATVRVRCLCVLWSRLL